MFYLAYKPDNANCKQDLFIASGSLQNLRRRDEQISSTQKTRETSLDYHIAVLIVRFSVQQQMQLYRHTLMALQILFSF